MRKHYRLLVGVTSLAKKETVKAVSFSYGKLMLMKVLILYRPKSEHSRKVETFIHDFERFHPGIEIEVRDLETREGAVAAKTYDITSYPGILALQDDGAVLQLWQGDLLPLMNDVASYAQ